jgi:hypothetical protein
MPCLGLIPQWRWAEQLGRNKLACSNPVQKTPAGHACAARPQDNSLTSSPAELVKVKLSIPSAFRAETAALAAFSLANGPANSRFV